MSILLESGISVYPPPAGDPVSQMVLACELLMEAVRSTRRRCFLMAEMCVADAERALANAR